MSSNTSTPLFSHVVTVPLALSCLIWPVLIGLAAGNVWTPELIRLPSEVSGMAWPAPGNFLLGLSLGGLMFAALRDTRALGAPIFRVFAAALALAFWSLLLGGFPSVAPDGWLWLMTGGLAGLGLAFLAPRGARFVKSPAAASIRGVWVALLLSAPILLLLPSLGAENLPALSLTGGVTGYPAAVAQRAYQMVKTAMPWLPMGMLLALVMPSMVIRLWAVCAVVGFFWVALLLPAAVGLVETLDILFTLPGLALGLWLGERLPMSPLGEPVAPKAERMRDEAGADESRSVSLVANASLETVSASVFEPVRVSRAASKDLSTEADSGRRSRSATRGVATLPGRLFGLILLVLAGVALLDFSRWQLAIGLGLAGYMLLLWLRPSAWLVVVPAALPLLDLAPWTGRFFLDEFDLLMLVTAGLPMLRGRRGPTLPARPLFRPLTGLLAVSVVVSCFLGLLPLPPLDANAFASYWSPYNSLRVAKGFLWGGLIFLWIRRAQLDHHVLARPFALGMGLGLLGVGVIGAWEHGLFVGFQGGHETYRIVSTFSSMHTGGGHIEAYLVAALPFLWLATTRLRHFSVSGPLAVLTAFVMLYTVARGGVLALGVVTLILLLASSRIAQLTGGRRFLAPIGMLAGLGLLLVAVGTGGGYFQQRFTESGQDWQTRLDHWAQAVDMMDGTFQAQLFGMGLGSFPRAYLERGPADKQAASFGFAAEQGNTYFRLGTGGTVYYAQRIPFTAGQNYRLELDVRSRQGEARLDTPVCEKQMLNSRQCEWFGFVVPGDGRWHRLSRDFSSAKVGAQDSLHRPPVELSLHHPGKAGVVDVDNLRLLDRDGRDLLCNGDFSRGGDCWFFKTQSHLPWHIKNVWVHVLFEQGWVGLLAFAGLILLALSRLARAGWRGQRLAWAWLASLAGLLTVGMFDSLLDAPRLATLLVALILLGAGHDWEPAGRSRRHRRGRQAPVPEKVKASSSATA